MTAPDLAAVEQALRIDAATVRTVAALRAAGVPTLLLKGRALARELYDSPAERTYADCDLLVRIADVEAAEAVLAARGLRRTSPGFEESLPAHQRHAHDWTPSAPGGVPVELHWSVVGVGAPDERVWDALAPHVAPLAVGGGEVATLHGPGTAWLVALHAAQHGADQRPLADLERALSRLDRPTWEEAAALARTLDAEPAFARGLRLLPAGAGLAAQLGLSDAAPAAVELLAGDAPGGALVLDRLAGAPRRERLTIVARTLVPSPGAMRALKPLARRGRVGLLAAYLWRPLDLARQLGPAWRAWRAAAHRRD